MGVLHLSPPLELGGANWSPKGRVGFPLHSQVSNSRHSPQKRMSAHVRFHRRSPFELRLKGKPNKAAQTVWLGASTWLDPSQAPCCCQPTPSQRSFTMSSFKFGYTEICNPTPSPPQPHPLVDAAAPPPLPQNPFRSREKSGHRCRMGSGMRSQSLPCISPGGSEVRKHRKSCKASQPPFEFEYVHIYGPVFRVATPPRPPGLEPRHPGTPTPRTRQPATNHKPTLNQP